MVQKHMLIEERGKRCSDIMSGEIFQHTLLLSVKTGVVWICRNSTRSYYRTHGEYMQKCQMVIICSHLYSKERAGVLYSTAAIIDGTTWANTTERIIFRIHQVSGKVLFKFQEISGILFFQTRYAKVGVYICYDRHFLTLRVTSV